MDRSPAVVCAATSESWRRDSHTGSAFYCLDCRKHHGALFHASAVFPSGCGDDRWRNTRLRRAVLLSLRLSIFLTQRRRNRSELEDRWMPLTN